MRMLNVYWKEVPVAKLAMKADEKFEYTLIIPNLRKAKKQGLQVGTIMNSGFDGSFPEWIIDRVPKGITEKKEIFKWLSKTGGRLQTDQFSFKELS